MIILASTHIDDETFSRLETIAAYYNIRLKQKAIRNSFDLPRRNRRNYTALNRLDAITSIYKGLSKLKDFQSV